jgi:hypothetical protein
MAAGGTVKPLCFLGLMPIFAEHLELEKAFIRWAFTVEVAFLVVLNEDRDFAAAFEAPQKSLCLFKHLATSEHLVAYRSLKPHI